ncbi:outer membrane beta-barrel protein [Marinicellulosiphila megalodicopiae]|uniref:outer membrane beta-barrel protein n=1 Tax=Marinicellulosiphila megalodicopiae TaxID=2724896 RepID=UPI003BB08BBF
MKHTNKKSFIVLGLCSALSTATFAAQTPGSINTESGIDLTPLLNITAKNDAATRDEELYTSLTPSLTAELLDGANQYLGTTDLEIGVYSEDENDNFVDFNLGGEANIEFSANSFLQTTIDIEFGHEATLSAEVDGDLTRFITPAVGGFYQYNLSNNISRVRALFNVADKTYTNFEDEAEFLELTTAGLGVEYYYDQDAQTTYIAELTFENSDYKKTNPTGDQDSLTSTAKVGVQFVASELLSGEVRIGLAQKDFANSAKEDFSGFSWNANVDWAPRSYSTFAFTTGFVVNDASGVEDFITESTFGANWSHQWSSVLSSSAALNHTLENYEGIDRVDNTTVLNLGGVYSFATTQPKLDLTFGLELTHVDSELNVLDSDDTLVNIGLDVML